MSRANVHIVMETFKEWETYNRTIIVKMSKIDRQVFV